MRRKSTATDAMPAAVRKLRCAVYIRKSTEEGLEKEFNGLDAQRCAGCWRTSRPGRST